MVNKLTGDISSICYWGDNRDYPTDVTLDANMEIQVVDDVENSPVKHDTHKYDHATISFVEFTPIPVVQAPYVEPEILALRAEIAKMKADISLKANK